jgi:hypothetical protein
MGFLEYQYFIEDFSHIVNDSISVDLSTSRNNFLTVSIAMSEYSVSNEDGCLLGCSVV